MKVAHEFARTSWTQLWCRRLARRGNAQSLRYNAITAGMRAHWWLTGADWACAMARFSAASSTWFAPSSLARKNIPLFIRPKSAVISMPSRLDNRGGSRVVTNAGRDAVDAGSVRREACSQGGYPW